MQFFSKINSIFGLEKTTMTKLGGIFLYLNVVDNIDNGIKRRVLLMTFFSFCLVSVLYGQRKTEVDTISYNVNDTFYVGYDKVLVKGNIVLGKKVGIWKFTVYYSDYDGRLFVEYLDNGNILFDPQNIEYGNDVILIVDKKYISIIDYQASMQIKNICNYDSGKYCCYSFKWSRQKIVNTKFSTLFEAFSYLRGGVANKEVFEYILK